ncbi:exopolysaccharide biosynthesis protein [Psychromarinibacter sp. C21-152]|uniref:Exopolysaccharide biosynthesis protein n=1 Tax=Psychromarinibacter sediminicola TaxID=3033385 RepID=A0AAE3NW89_9RHOB|nr:exopolysaccharide biosynthesis protein [Psychromarinibacter sediminicola]MDF0603426.1 exopolysaccharide biosynthesis protein [Psychromarinibacter sediminicola]
MTLDRSLGAASAATPRRLSGVLRDLESGLGPRIALGDLVSGLRDRSFAPLMVLFAVPNVFLYIPGSSVITGLPLMILALQLVAGRSSVWLPRALSDRSVDRASFARIVHYSLPWVERIERLARPRLWPGATASVDRLIGVACLVMALLLFLPIPFANGVPALAIIALGLALSERDGVWLILGCLGSVFAVVFVAAIIGGGAFAVARIF